MFFNNTQCHHVIMSLSRDNVSIKTQKYAHFQRFCHAISAVFNQKSTDYYYYLFNTPKQYIQYNAKRLLQIATNNRKVTFQNMRSTKACDVDALIRSCAKGTCHCQSRVQYTCIRCSKTATDLTLLGCCATGSAGTCSFRTGQCR